MSHETNDLLPLVREVTSEPAELQIESNDAGAGQPLPTPEQTRAADGVFAPHSEQESAAALLVVWSTAQLLHGLAVDALAAPKEEEDQEEKAERDTR